MGIACDSSSLSNRTFVDIRTVELFNGPFLFRPSGKNCIQNAMCLAFRPHHSLAGCRIAVQHDELFENIKSKAVPIELENEAICENGAVMKWIPN